MIIYDTLGHRKFSELELNFIKTGQQYSLVTARGAVDELLRCIILTPVLVTALTNQNYYTKAKLFTM